MTTLRQGSAGHDSRDEQSWPYPPDPGDLSRRIIQRRTELRLTTGQVAERARINPRYLEYVERFPARPTASVLRQLAAALRTTPAALLGGGADLPAGHWVPAGGQMERLTPLECRRLIAPGGIGRIGLITGSGPLVLPVNYAYIADTVVVRTGAGSPVAAHATESVAFEVDRIDDALSQGWSVLVCGQAHPVLQPAEQQNLLASPDPRPWPLGHHDLYVRIVPGRITGRRIHAQ
jgi:nitroimidazol reductase NimA-like FMN-containing flavoprotein (pyridoxamine 5'-phosphate oxidase superfamily)